MVIDYRGWGWIASEGFNVQFSIASVNIGSYPDMRAASLRTTIVDSRNPFADSDGKPTLTRKVCDDAPSGVQVYKWSVGTYIELTSEILRGHF